MKKILALSLALIFMFVLIGCDKHSQIDLKNVPEFSYTEESDMYAQNKPGVKTDGFKNTSKCKISTDADAIEHAKNECTVEWDNVKAYFDPVKSVWKIVFYPEGASGEIVGGGDQTVYMNDKGVTILIVYGE